MALHIGLQICSDIKPWSCFGVRTHINSRLGLAFGGLGQVLVGQVLALALADAVIQYSKGKGKVFPYSLPSVGPGADPGVQAVSPQVT